MERCKQKMIAQEIYPICYYVEQEIVRHQDLELCRWWGAKDAFRHSLTLRSIVKYLNGTEARNGLKILNLSGLYPGHQDFSICHYLKNRMPIEYYAVDHPNSPYLSTPAFVCKVSEFGIHTIYKDMKELTVQDIRDRMNGCPDIVLFTEIAEHLEHGTFLRCLQLIAEILPSHGLLLLSTPNADALKSRIDHLLGRRLDHWGDGTANMANGLFGHIVYYNIPRLRRLLRDVGLEIRKSSTVNFPVVGAESRGARKRVEQIKLAIVDGLIVIGETSWRIPTLMNAMKTMGNLVYLEVQKGTEEKVPFAL
jgi:hypothetical protein